MHGIRYTEVIGDGDSSVLYTIQMTVQSYGRDVEKTECTNHAIKCFLGQLESWQRTSHLSMDEAV